MKNVVVLALLLLFASLSRGGDLVEEQVRPEIYSIERVTSIYSTPGAQETDSDFHVDTRNSPGNRGPDAVPESIDASGTVGADELESSKSDPKLSVQTAAELTSALKDVRDESAPAAYNSNKNGIGLEYIDDAYKTAKQLKMASLTDDEYNELLRESEIKYGKLLRLSSRLRTPAKEGTVNLDRTDAPDANEYIYSSYLSKDKPIFPIGIGFMVGNKKQTSETSRIPSLEIQADQAVLRSSLKQNRYPSTFPTITPTTEPTTITIKTTTLTTVTATTTKRPSYKEAASKAKKELGVRRCPSLQDIIDGSKATWDHVKQVDDLQSGVGVLMDLVFSSFKVFTGCMRKIYNDVEEWLTVTKSFVREPTPNGTPSPLILPFNPVSEQPLRKNTKTPIVKGKRDRWDDEILFT